jgi:hypothetical protein
MHARSFVLGDIDRSLRLHFAAGVYLLLALCVLPPWYPSMPSSNLDPSWAAVLSYAFEKQWQFGKDIVFTLGPYSFIYTKLFSPQTYGITLSFWLVATIVVILTVAHFSARLRSVEKWTVLGVLLISLFVTGDTALPFISLLMLCAALAAESRVGRVLVFVLLVLSALVGLVKFSYAIVGFTMVLLLDMYSLQQRRTPFYTLLYVSLSVLFFALAGQSSRNFWEYIRTSLWMASGFTEAMEVTGPIAELLLFGACAVSIGAYIVYRRYQQKNWGVDGPRGLVMILGISMFVFMAFKAGFVRHDGHSLIAWSSLGAASAIYSVFVLPESGSRGGRNAVLGACALLAMFTVARYLLLQPPSLMAPVTAMSEWLKGSRGATLQSAYAAAWADVRAQDPLPRLTGTVDLYPRNQSTVMAHGLDYLPRPVFQSYAVYSRPLVELNRRHLHSERAAENVLFDVETLDHRVAALHEGSLWPDMLSRYHGAGITRGYVLLKKRSEPITVEAIPVSQVTTTWLERVDVPTSALPVWVSITLHKTVIGTLLNVLYKPPLVDLSVTFDDGTKEDFRLVPELGSAGFVLVPFIRSKEEFHDFMTDWQRNGRGTHRVSAIAVAGETGVRWAYRADIKVEFARLCVKYRAPASRIHSERNASIGDSCEALRAG